MGALSLPLHYSSVLEARGEVRPPRRVYDRAPPIGGCAIGPRDVGRPLQVGRWALDEVWDVGIQFCLFLYTSGVY